jgi:hypothetical protein
LEKPKRKKIDESIISEYNHCLLFKKKSEEALLDKKIRKKLRN